MWAPNKFSFKKCDWNWWVGASFGECSEIPTHWFCTYYDKNSVRSICEKHANVYRGKGHGIAYKWEEISKEEVIMRFALE